MTDREIRSSNELLEAARRLLAHWPTDVDELVEFYNLTEELAVALIDRDEEIAALRELVNAAIAALADSKRKLDEADARLRNRAKVAA